MKSLQHVLWRGALAVSLMAVGIGTGLGMPAAERAAAPGDCTLEPRALIADDVRDDGGRAQGTTLILVRRAISPAG